MKKMLAVLIMCLITANSLYASAALNLNDAFGNEYVEFDVNIDGAFDIKDLVRIKKYYAGIPVTLNLNFTDSEEFGSGIIAVMQKKLLNRCVE